MNLKDCSSRQTPKLGLAAAIALWAGALACQAAEAPSPSAGAGEEGSRASIPALPTGIDVDSWKGNFPGGLALVPLPEGFSHRSSASFNGRQVLIVAAESGPTAVVGLGTGAKPGDHRLGVWNGADKSVDLPFSVVDRSYKTVSFDYPRKFHSYDEPTLARIRREQNALRRLKKTHSEMTPDLAFVWPTHGRLSSPFGRRRVFQNHTSVHSGLDIANLTGTEVYAASSGVVLNAHHYYLTGKTVLLDHGSGVLSLYAHLNDYTVKDGQQVTKGELIGNIGSTGRSTGPHLHLSIGFNGQWVDPAILLPEKSAPSQ